MNKTTYICLSPGQPSISAELLHFCGGDVTVAILVMRLEQCGNVSSTEFSHWQKKDYNNFAHWLWFYSFYRLDLFSQTLIVMSGSLHLHLKIGEICCIPIPLCSRSYLYAEIVSWRCQVEEMRLKESMYLEVWKYWKKNTVKLTDEKISICSSRPCYPGRGLGELRCQYHRHRPTAPACSEIALLATAGEET